MELSMFKSPDGKAVLFGDMDPRDARQGDRERKGEASAGWGGTRLKASD